LAPNVAAFRYNEVMTSDERYIVTMDARGRIVIPAAVRRQIGLQTGGRLLIIVDGDDVILRPIRD
jgi:AbrB family looped-hinge helix DNA binding protein